MVGTKRKRIEAKIERGREKYLDKTGDEYNTRSLATDATVGGCVGGSRCGDDSGHEGEESREEKYRDQEMCG